jgi:hypothetical protein
VAALTLINKTNRVSRPVSLKEIGITTGLKSSGNDQQYAMVSPLLYSIHWPLHVSAVVCHLQIASKCF